MNAWDCSRPQTLQLWNIPEPGTSGGQTINVTNVSAPNTGGSVNPAGSPAGTANSTMNGFDQCNRTHTDGAAGAGAGYAKLPYSNEGDVVNSQAKRDTLNLAPMETTRPAAPYQLALGKGMPPNFGIQALGQYGDTGTASGADGLWHNNVHFVEGTPGYNYDVFNLTFYGYVSTNAITAYGLTLPNGASTGVYGSPTCGGFSSGIHNGWQCDANLWYRDDAGNDIEPESGYLGPAPGAACGSSPRPIYCVGARVGYAFNLRDIDCYDQSAMGARENGVNLGSVHEALDGIHRGCDPMP